MGNGSPANERWNCPSRATNDDVLGGGALEPERIDEHIKEDAGEGPARRTAHSQTAPATKEITASTMPNISACMGRHDRKAMTGGLVRLMSWSMSRSM